MTMNRTKEELKQLKRDVIALNTPDDTGANSHCRDASGSVCGYCGTKGLRWKRFRGGYNMLTKSGRRAHRCKGYRKEQSEQIKF